MKKAKIFLAAITVLAVVGGALAFKAKSISNQYLFTCIVTDDYCSVSKDSGGEPLNVIEAQATDPESIVTTGNLIPTKQQGTIIGCDEVCDGPQLALTVE